MRAGDTLWHADDAYTVSREANASSSGRLQALVDGTFGPLHVVPDLPRFLDEHPEHATGLNLNDRIIDFVVQGVDASQMGTAIHRSVNGLPVSQTLGPAPISQGHCKQETYNPCSLDATFCKRSPLTYQATSLCMRWASETLLPLNPVVDSGFK